MKTCENTLKYSHKFQKMYFGKIFLSKCVIRFEFFEKNQAKKMCYLPIFRNVFSASEPFFK